MPQLILILLTSIFLWTFPAHAAFKTLNFTYNLTTVTGSQSLTGFGFTPVGCISMGAVAGSTADNHITFNGAVDSARAARSIAGKGTAGTITTTANFLHAVAAGGTANMQAATVSAYGSDGLTLAWTKTGSPTGTFSFYVTWWDSAAPIAIKSFTYDLTTATGTQALTGFGFTPIGCWGFGAVDSAASSSYIVYHGAVDSARSANSIFGAGASGTNTTGAVLFQAVNAGGTAFQSAVVNSYDSGGLTLGWTKNSTPSGTFAFTLACYH